MICVLFVCEYAVIFLNRFWIVCKNICCVTGQANGKYTCPKIYFNHRCFSGPYLNKGRIAELPQCVGPGSCVLVLKEVCVFVINVSVTLRNPATLPYSWFFSVLLSSVVFYSTTFYSIVISDHFQYVLASLTVSLNKEPTALPFEWEPKMKMKLFWLHVQCSSAGFAMSHDHNTFHQAVITRRVA